MENREKEAVERENLPENESPKAAAVTPALPKQSRLYSVKIVALFAFAAFGAAILGLALLTNIMERKNEARNPFFRVVELTDDTVDPEIWGKNFPLQYDGYKRTVDQVRTRYGGSEAVPHTPSDADPRSVVAQSRLEEDPRLKTMWDGYAFAVDFR
jgi:nitrite reductase (cytochrome c-552)